MQEKMEKTEGDGGQDSLCQEHLEEEEQPCLFDNTEVCWDLWRATKGQRIY